ncbi:MAG: phosphopantetheine-binding protein [Chloroflexi bacterium]|nr:phosphopantetheine-binding protein [Chloroflexota bacterium]
MEVIPAVREFITTELLQRSDLALDDDVALIDEGYLTSLQTVELLMFLEENFKIEIDPSEVDEENFHSLNTIAALVERKL